MSPPGAPDLLPLETPRLRLRHFRDTDVDAFFAYRNDPQVARWQSWDGITREAARDFARAFSMGGPAPPGTWFQIAVAERATDALAGDCALKLLADPPAAAEIGFTFARHFQGRGYAYEAVGRLISHLFDEFGLERVVAETDAENVRSCRLLERLGMRREGSSSAWFKGGITEEYRYGLNRGEWRTTRGASSLAGPPGGLAPTGPA